MRMSASLARNVDCGPACGTSEVRASSVFSGGESGSAAFSSAVCQAGAFWWPSSSPNVIPAISAATATLDPKRKPAVLDPLTRLVVGDELPDDEPHVEHQPVELRRRDGVLRLDALDRVDDPRDALDEPNRLRQLRGVTLGGALDEVLEQRAREGELVREVERCGVARVLVEELPDARREQRAIAPRLRLVVPAVEFAAADARVVGVEAGAAPAILLALRVP